MLTKYAYKIIIKLSSFKIHKKTKLNKISHKDYSTIKTNKDFSSGQQYFPNFCKMFWLGAGELLFSA